MRDIVDIGFERILDSIMFFFYLLVKITCRVSRMIEGGFEADIGVVVSYHFFSVRTLL